MSITFDSLDQAFAALANPGSPEWAQPFAFLSSHPDTAELMLDTFRETLQEMGAEPSGVDPASGEPVYTLSDVSKALGIPEPDLDDALDNS